MHNQKIYSEDLGMPWRAIIIAAALAKAGVIGVSLGLAFLGALDIAFAVTAHDWLEMIRTDLYFDRFALGGGIMGVIGQAVREIFFR